MGERPEGAGEHEPAEVLVQSEDVDLSEPPSAPSPAAGVPAAHSLTRGGAQAPLGAGLAALVVANLLPLVGVLALGWQVFPIMFLYWIENLVVGCFTMFKIGTARGAPLDDDMSRVGLLLYFPFGYGIFTLAQGGFVVVLFSGLVVPQPGPPSGAPAGLNLLWLGAVVCGLVVSHAVSYRRNWLASGRYLTVSPAAASGQPAGRVMVLQVAIIAGGWFVDSLGAPIGSLLVLVVLKTILDAYGYLRQHRVPVV